MLTHPISLIFENGQTLRISAGEQETLHAAALRNGIRLESDCLEGACATCKALCTSGHYAMRDYSEDALSPEEARRGLVLLCRTVARGAAVIELPYEPREGTQCAEPSERSGRIAGVERVSASVIRMDVALSDTAFVFLPGQYANLRVPGAQAWRKYSFANAPMSAGALTFYIKLIPGGAMSEYVAAHARVGDAVDLKAPYGHFYLRQPRRPLLLVAGGSGLAPMLSMLEQLMLEGTCAQPIHLLYGANDPGDFFGVAQLASYAANGLQIRHELVALKSSAGWTGALGHVTSRLRTEMHHQLNCDAYLCGPPPMVEAAQKWLMTEGLSVNAVHAERFTASL